MGRTAPVGTNFEARITVVPRSSSGIVDAKVVDGDRELWLRVRPNARIVIRGALGELLLRFNRSGVFVNERSVTAQADRIDLADLDPVSNSRARPIWHRLTAGHAYLWHEHRLHALEPLARGHGAKAVVGRWSVPMSLDGRHEAIEGDLVYTPAGSVWPLLVLACAVAVGLLVFARLSADRVAVGAALVATSVVWSLRIGREAYGRPGVGVFGYVQIALTSAVGVALLYGLVNRERDVRVFTALLAGVGSLYQALTMLGVLTHAIALTTLPTTFARVSVALSLGLGTGLVAITLRRVRVPGAVHNHPGAFAGGIRE